MEYGTIWSEDFYNAYFLNCLKRLLQSGSISPDVSHVHRDDGSEVPGDVAKIGIESARKLRAQRAIMGIFDGGRMGMYNAMILAELLQPLVIYKKRLNLSSLYAKMQTVSDIEAGKVFNWLEAKGMRFHLGASKETSLTESQIIHQCKMSIAALRIADEFGCALIEIQYQQGLEDLRPASDLAEGPFNNIDRPLVCHEETKSKQFPGEALPHFNEAVECAGVDALITNRVWRQLGYPPETTLHGIKWGRRLKGDGIDESVWVFDISASIPAAYIDCGYSEPVSERQLPVYFRLGGGTLKGVSKPGSIAWSRLFIEGGKLKWDIELGKAVKLPKEETEERSNLTNREWPMMHTELKGGTRGQMMARHEANHIQVAYAPDEKRARRTLYAKAAAMNELGVDAYICGRV